MSRVDYWLVLVVTFLSVGCSCVNPAQELSSYWKGHDFTSLDAFDDIDAAEDKFDGYISLLNSVSHEEAVARLTEFLDSAALNPVAYMVWASWFEPFLHSLESPRRNDDLFVVWLDKVLEDNVIDDGAVMDRLRRLRDVMGGNAVGMPPQELKLTSEDGADFMLSDLRGERTLVMFVDADCPSCLKALEENAGEYREASLVAVLVGGSPMHMVNIRRQLSERIAAQWTFAFCPVRRLEDESLYDLSLLPFRLLMNKDWIIEKSYH